VKSVMQYGYRSKVVDQECIIELTRDSGVSGLKGKEVESQKKTKPHA